MSLNSADLVHFFHGQINRIRKQPASAVPLLQARKFVNPFEYCHSLLSNVHYKTSEGQQAVKQAIEYLSNAPSVPDLKLSNYLCEAAYNIGVEVNKLGHDANINQYTQLMQLEMTKAGIIESSQTNIIIQHGFKFDPDIVPSIVVDDGDRSRYSRNALMNPNQRFIGISIHEHRQYDYLLIILINEVTKTKQGCSCTIF